MPKTPVDECPAGPEMDAAVAEAAGWVKNFLYDHDGLPKRVAYVDPSDDYREVVADITVWHPSIDIAAAWELWQWLSERAPWSWALYSELDGDVTIEYYGGTYIGDREAGCGDWEMEDKAPLVISRAFLKINGIEYIEVPE